MSDYLMGIDYGTGGAKTVIIDTQGNEVGFSFNEFPIIINKPGWSEHNPQIYWESTCRMVKESLAQGRINPKDIRAISMSSAIPALVMVDKNNNPIHNAYNLMDRRAKVEVEWVKKNIGEDRMFAISGNRLEDHPTIVNLLWERNNRPDNFNQIKKALTIDTYIRLKMTGKCISSYSNLALYGVYDIVKHRFDESVLEEMDIDLSIFPEPCPCGVIVGELTNAAAADLGLSPGTPVTSGQLDCNAGWVGAGAIEEGDIQMNLGTVGNFGVIHKDTNFLRSMLVAPYTIDSANTYVTVPTTTTGGMSIRYLRDQFSKQEIEVERTLGIDAYDLLNIEAGKIPQGSDGLVILPFLMGERSPIWDVDARGVIFGLSLNHTKGHIVRAMMEAVAFALYHNFSIIKEARTKLNFPIVLNEGGAKSHIWRRIITDVFNVPTVLVKRRTGAPFGNAILSGVAIGIFKDFSVAREWTEYIDLMEPDKDAHDCYMDYFKVYRQLYENVRQNFKDLSSLREKYAR